MSRTTLCETLLRLGPKRNYVLKIGKVSILVIGIECESTDYESSFDAERHGVNYKAKR